MDDINFDKKELMESIHEEVEKFNRLSKAVFGKSSESEEEDKNVDVKSYVKYILKEGRKDEKRELLKSLRSEFILLNGKIIASDKES